MNNDFINEELSAYLDGESDDPASVGQVLRGDPEAAQRYAQFAALSEHLRSLPAPEVSPAFATRVLAHAREEAEASGIPWFSPRRVAWALAGLGFIVVMAVAVTLFARMGQSKDSLDGNPHLARVSTEHGPLPIEGAEPVPPDDPGSLYPDSPQIDYEDTLASVEVLEQEEDSYTANADLDSMLNSLSDSELQAFKALLAEYAEGSRSI
ncbi:MAG: hypothetical protein K1Y02_00035 [Candidatus Hydrogenedentes bacterium]|nr:hypothetical protein [Candidatus Hydrogenedentota bacterium]